jgi:hypothetical protein
MHKVFKVCNIHFYSQSNNSSSSTRCNKDIYLFIFTMIRRTHSLLVSATQKC